MLLRIATAAVLIPIVVAFVWWGPPALLAALACVIAVLALFELFGLGDKIGLRAFKKWTYFSAALVFYSQYSEGLVQIHSFSEGVSVVRNAAAGLLSLDAVLLIFVFGCVALGLATRRPLLEVLPAIAISSVGIFFVALPFSYIVRVNEIERVGKQLVLFTLVLIWAGDMLAYFVGKSVGRLKIAPALSPKKTWEGSIANVIASALVAGAFARWMQLDTLTLIAIAAAANIAGQAGDLIESAYKRGASVKDSGALLPGHGGMLDRIDSLILAAPVVWILYQWLQGTIVTT
jgi:phosphatidate cytidylyltransferase